MLSHWKYPTASQKYRTHPASVWNRIVRPSRIFVFNKRRRTMSDKTYPMLINGQTVLATKSFEVINPSTGQVLGRVPQADPASIQQSLQAAAQGFKVWSTTSPAERKTVILRYADLLEENSERIIALLRAES